MPHYVSLTPSPRAAKALVDRLAELLEADVDTAELDEAADSYAQQVSEAVASDAETSAYVEELERRVDEIAAEEDIPSGDAIAAELTRYLRERENGTTATTSPATSSANERRSPLFSRFRALP